MFYTFFCEIFYSVFKKKSDVILYVHVSWITYSTAVLCITLQQFVALYLIDTTQFPLHIKFCKAFIHLRRGSLKPCSLFYEVRLRHVLILVSSYCMLTFDVETLHFILFFLILNLIINGYDFFCFHQHFVVVCLCRDVTRSLWLFFFILKGYGNQEKKLRLFYHRQL